MPEHLLRQFSHPLYCVHKPEPAVLSGAGARFGTAGYREHSSLSWKAAVANQAPGHAPGAHGRCGFRDLRLCFWSSRQGLGGSAHLPDVIVQIFFQVEGDVEAHMPSAVPWGCVYSTWQNLALIFL